MESLIQLIYVSTAAADTDEAVVQRILDVARRHNAAHGISGALLVYAGHFLQVLEGLAGDVNALYARIRRDRRHHHVVLVDFGPLTQREFEGWAMRHVPGPRGHDRAVTGFLDELAASPDTERAHTALVLMQRLASASAE